MYETITHMFSDVRPFDWLMLVVELLVLVIIAAEWIRSCLHARRKKKATARILEFLAQGQIIRAAVPRDTHDAEKDVASWIERVNAWINDVQSYLSKDAKNAVLAFTQATLGPSYQLTIHPKVESAFHYFDS